MNQETTIRLARHFDLFIEDQIAQRKYLSATEVIEDALRLLETREAKLEALRRALIEGEQSGPAGPFDIEEIIAAAKGEARQRAADAQDR